jgi:aerobic carbon-monoxide dehydrogenase large subunit
MAPVAPASAPSSLGVRGGCGVGCCVPASDGSEVVEFMNARIDSQKPDAPKVAIGQSLPRKEDAKLLQGQGRYTDDVNLPGQAYAAIVRSSTAHGVIRSIDTAAAKAMPGVLGIYTATDLDAAGFGTFKTMINFPNRDGSPMHKPVRRALARDRVRFVGDPVACVVAETGFQAKDAAEAVTVEIDPLPAVTRARDAAAAGAPLVYDDVPGNIVLDYHFGDADKVKDAFARTSRASRSSTTAWW